MLSVLDLEEMSKMEIEKIDRNNLVDINDIYIDQDSPAKQRMEKYLGQVKNPYCFMCGKTPVKIEFSPTGKSIDESLKSFFLGLKNR